MAADPKNPIQGRGLVAAVDLGSFKTACLVARIDASASVPVRIAGVSHVPSRGIKSGVIVDLAEAELTLRTAIAEAERMAGVRLSGIVAAPPCGRGRSQTFSVATGLAQGIVTEDDLDILDSNGRQYGERDGGRLIHFESLGYRLDGSPAALSPVGMAAGRMTCDFHAVSVDEAPLRNLHHVVERCYLSAERLVPAPYASAIGATTADERRVGVIVLDIGAGTTGISLFVDGRYIFSDVIPVGGQHITLDIARALQTPLEEAERIKTLYGTVLAAQSDGHEAVAYARTGEDVGPPPAITRAKLAEIVRARSLNILALVEERLAQAGFDKRFKGPVVVTGGSSELTGLIDLVARRLDRPVRAARAAAISGLPPLMSGPAFSGVTGVLLAAIEGTAAVSAIRSGKKVPGGYLGRVGHWLKDGF